ncbi:MAG: hypothetical protein U5J98_00745 [Halobacteriales archaeon]|nr:hypothetical protein [Halobacteriales archaeon]
MPALALGVLDVAEQAVGAGRRERRLRGRVVGVAIEPTHERMGVDQPALDVGLVDGRAVDRAEALDGRPEEPVLEAEPFDVVDVDEEEPVGAGHRPAGNGREVVEADERRAGEQLEQLGGGLEVARQAARGGERALPAPDRGNVGLGADRGGQLLGVDTAGQPDEPERRAGGGVRIALGEQQRRVDEGVVERPPVEPDDGVDPVLRPEEPAEVLAVGAHEPLRREDERQPAAWAEEPRRLR